MTKETTRYIERLCKKNGLFLESLNSFKDSISLLTKEINEAEGLLEESVADSILASSAYRHAVKFFEDLGDL